MTSKKQRNNQNDNFSGRKDMNYANNSTNNYNNNNQSRKPYNKKHEGGQGQYQVDDRNANQQYLGSQEQIKKQKESDYRNSQDNYENLKNKRNDDQIRLQIENNQLQRSLKQKEDEIQNLKDKNNDDQIRLQFENNQLQRFLKQKEDEIQNLKDKNNDDQIRLQFENNQLQRFLKQKEDEIQNLKDKNNKDQIRLQSEKEQYLQYHNQLQQSLESEIRNLKDKNNEDQIRLQSEKVQYLDKYNQLKQSLERKESEILNLKDKNNKDQTRLQSEILEKEKQLLNAQQSLNKSNNKNNDLANENEDLREKTAKLDNELTILARKNTLLADEASKYQSALGVATNFQLGDDDQNHAVNLNTDIGNLIDDLKKYVTNLKQGITVNMERVKKLLLRYNCSTEITDQKDDRLLIQAVLQRHIIETIFSYAEKYFESTGRHFHLESDIVKSEASLSLLLTHASKCRVGDDETTNVAPKKLRQQIYSILSNRGFSDIFGADNSVFKHPFIAHIKGRLDELMDELRIINNVQKKIDSEKIIREVIKIFWFRFKVQEPIVEYRWIPNNCKVDKTCMDGNISDDDENLYVDLCYFPLIGSDLGSDNRKIYTPAKIFTKLKPKPDVSNVNVNKNVNASNFNRNILSKHGIFL